GVAPAPGKPVPSAPRSAFDRKMRWSKMYSGSGWASGGGRVGSRMCVLLGRRRGYRGAQRNALPADRISNEGVPLLAQYVRHISRARKVATVLAQCEENGFALEDYQRLLKMEEQQTRAMSSPATRLRLTNQARQEPETASRQRRQETGEPRPWE
ncbi:MAG: hypothetical protein V5A42_06210, partial [Halofilum sp. (in: g-proteobacteria)]